MSSLHLRIPGERKLFPALSGGTDTESVNSRPTYTVKVWSLCYVTNNVGGRRNDTFQIAKGLHEPIIDIETWEAAERAKKQRATQPSRLGTGTFALSGLLYCGRCGAAMSGVTYYRKNKAESPPRRYYACGEREHNNLCKMPRILEAEIESKLISDIERDYRDLSRRARKATHTPKTSNVRESLEQELRKVRERKQRWMDAFEEGTIDAKDMRNRLDDLNERENSVLQQILLVNEPVEPDYRIQAELLRSLVRTWEHANVADRKDMLRTLISRIELTDDRTLRVEYK